MKTNGMKKIILMILEKTMPEEVKMQNMYLVGEDLYDCFNRMVLEEE